MENGIFIISLDLELAWGSLHRFDRIDKEKFLQTRVVISRLLDIFLQYGIHATWGVVGALKCRNREELLKLLNSDLEYPTLKLNVNELVEKNIGKDKQTDLIFFAPDLIEKIRNMDGQYIGSHSFSHYFCHENQNEKDFNQDVLSFLKVEPGFRTFIFPKNQVANYALDILQKHGVYCYRGNQKNGINIMIYGGRYPRFVETFLKGIRFLDIYFPITGHYYYGKDEIPQPNGTYNVRASSQFRPYKKQLAALESFKLRRIFSSMRKAAQEGKVYHLWWHPFDFAANSDIMLNQLRTILDEYKNLNRLYGFQSLSMEEMVDSI